MFGKYFATIALVSALALLTSVQAQAASPVLKSVVGEPLRLEFSDGRVAVMKVSSVTIPQARLPVLVTETLCSPHQNLRCAFELDLVQRYYFFAWSKHPDANKLQQRIFTTDTSSSTPTELTFSTIGLENSFAPRLTASQPKTRLACDDFSWLPGGQTQAPASLTVSRWEAEDMLLNPETAANENRGETSALNVALHRISDHQLSIDQIGSVSSLASPGFIDMLLLVVKTPISLSIATSAADSCQASLQVDSAKLGAQFGLIQRPDPALEKNVYVVGSDEVLSRPRLFNFRSMFQRLQTAPEESFK